MGNKHYKLLFLFYCIVFHADAQDIFAWRKDPGKVFTVFQNGRFYYPDEAVIQSGYLTGNDGIVYTNSQREVKYYSQGIGRKLLDLPPESFKISGERMAWTVQGNLYTTRRHLIKHLGSGTVWYHVSDSFMMFQDRYGSLQIYSDLAWIQPEMRPIKSYKAGRTLSAWINDRNEFAIYHRHRVAFRLDYAPDQFTMGAKTLAFADRDGLWKAFWNDSIYPLSNEMLIDTPQCGENKIAWVNRLHEFMCLDNGKLQYIDFQPPKWFEVRDSFVIYLSQEGHLKVFENGKSFVLEPGSQTNPSQVLSFGSIVVWLNRLQHVMKFENEKITNISQGVAYDLKLQGNVIIYKTNNEDLHLHWNTQKHVFPAMAR